MSSIGYYPEAHALDAYIGDEAEHLDFPKEAPIEAPREFASRDNYLESAKYLNDSLLMHGLPAVSIDSSSDSDKAALLNVLHRLLTDRQQASQQRTQLSDELSRMSSDLSHCQHRLAAVTDELKEQEKQRWELEMRRRTAEREYQAAEKKWKKTVEDLKKDKLMIQRRDNQYKHELRKFELQYSKIQEQLTRLINTRTPSGGSGGGGSGMAGGGGARDKGDGKQSIDVLNGLKGERAKWKPANKGETELLQHTVNAYEERLNAVVAENADLRTTLRALEQELQTALSESNARAAALANGQASETPLSPGTTSALEAFHPNQFSLPFALAGQNITAGIKAKIKILKQQLERLRVEEQSAQSMQADQNTLNKLKQLIGDLMNIIREQDSIIQSLIASADESQNEEERFKENRRWSMQAEAEMKAFSDSAASNPDINQYQNLASSDPSLTAQWPKSLARQAFVTPKRIPAAAPSYGVSVTMADNLPSPLPLLSPGPMFSPMAQRMEMYHADQTLTSTQVNPEELGALQESNLNQTQSV